MSEVFTGLVADLGEVQEAANGEGGVRMAVRSGLAAELAEGDSVAVNGVCLTAVDVAGDRFTTDVMHETLRRSSLAGVRRGSRVNLELALRAGDRMGGHVVQGHVDGVGEVVGVADDGFARLVSVSAPPALLRYLVVKGSVAVDGVSLTVAALGDDRFTVSLVPETLRRTTLGDAVVATPVNVEVDVIAKYVERLVTTQR